MPTPATPAAAANVPVWQPDPALLDQLDDYREVEGYEIRIPKECDSAPIPPEMQDIPYAKSKMLWTKLRLSNDDSALSLVLVVAQLPRGVAGDGVTPDQMLKQILDADKKNIVSNLSDWQHTPPESGRVGDVPFARVSYHGTTKDR